MDLKTSEKRPKIPGEYSLKIDSSALLRPPPILPPIEGSYTVVDATEGNRMISGNQGHRKRKPEKHKRRPVADQSQPTDLEGQNQNVLDVFVPLTSFALQGSEISNSYASSTNAHGQDREIENRGIRKPNDYAVLGECTASPSVAGVSPLVLHPVTASVRGAEDNDAQLGASAGSRGAYSKASSPPSFSPMSKTELGNSGIPVFSPHSITTAEETERPNLSLGSSYQSEENNEQLKEPCASCCAKPDVLDQWYKKTPRKHAFQRPLHINQIGAGVVQVIALYCFWGAVVPGLALLYRDREETTALLELVVLATLTVTSSFFFYSSWLIISFMDNTDLGKNGGQLCVYCGRRTMVDSKHCKACNKCVTGFDHHCKWLNMCIGSTNYKYFVVYMLSGISSMVIALVSGVLFLAQWWNELRYFSLYFRIVPFFLVALMAVCLPPILKLLGFHIMLNIRGITTYAYIIEKRQAKAR